MMWRGVFVGGSVLLMAAGVCGQTLEWRNTFTFYGDNTEFFNPYRTGETLLGASLTTALGLPVGPHAEVLAGVFGDFRSGSDKGADEVKPVLSFRWRTASSTAVMGTLISEERHGYLEPLQASTLDITRQVEQGLQWLERRPGWQGEAYINWQHLNTSDSREIFDYGLVVRAQAAGRLAVEGQLHGLHHGGQLFQVGAVSNNTVWAAGVRAERALPPRWQGRLAMFVCGSAGTRDPFVEGQHIEGRGRYLRVGAEFDGVAEAFLIVWRGRDFISHEGDRHYGSVGSDGVWYRSRRAYEELGFRFRRQLDTAIDLRLEARLHRIDGDFDYSYRILVRTPFVLRLGGR